MATFTPDQIEKLVDRFSKSMAKEFHSLAIDQDKIENLDNLPPEARKRQERADRNDTVHNHLKTLFADSRRAERNGQSIDQVIQELVHWDQISFEEVRNLIPAVLSEVVREAAEPEFIGARLLPTINMGGVLNIEFPMVGAIADAEEVGPGNEYPIRKFSMASQGIVRMGKYGLRMEVQEEVTKFVKGFDIYGLMLRACGRAMARTKEKRIFAHLLAQGKTVFDNLDSNVLNTSGVGPSGAQNGTLTLSDIVTMAGEMINDGFNPDIVIINGLAWTVFAQSPELRHLVMMNGMTPMFRWPQGQAGVTPGSRENPLLHTWTQAPALSTQYVNPDASILGRTFSTVVTPYMPFTPSAGSTPALCNVIVADSRYLGAIIQGEDVSTEEFNDPRIDVRSVKFREYYALATQAEGLGLRIARNVALVRGLDPLTSVIFTNEVSSLAWPGSNKTALNWN